MKLKGQSSNGEVQSLSIW